MFEGPASKTSLQALAQVKRRLHHSLLRRGPRHLTGIATEGHWGPCADDSQGPLDADGRPGGGDSLPQRRRAELGVDVLQVLVDGSTGETQITGSIVGRPEASDQTKR